MADPVTLPPDVQAVKDRAAEISQELGDWLESNFYAADKRAVAVATLKMGVNLHIEVMV
jgi:hypothetical protein